MPFRRPDRFPRRKTDKRRPRIHIELPIYGVSLGARNSGQVVVHVNNGMEYGQVNEIAVVPVTRIAESQARRLIRPEAPEKLEEPRAEDITQSIKLLLAEQPLSTSRLHEILVTSGKGRGSQIRFDESLRTRASYENLILPRARWFDAAEGLLFVMVYGTLEPGTYGELADAIGKLLKSTDVSRCVVPTRSIRSLDVDATTDPSPRELCFALASCQYPAGMVDGTPPQDGFFDVEPGPADRSFSRLVDHLERTDDAWRPHLLLFTGDQVYVDSTAGLFDPSNLDGRFLRPYEQLYSSIFVQHVTRQSYVVRMLDDHEIRDNFENDNENENEKDALDTDLNFGTQAYLELQRRGSYLGSPAPGEPLWKSFDFFGYAFFVADTRTERDKRTAGAFLDKQIMSDAKRQLAALKAWLSLPNPENRPRFVVSPSLLIPRRLSTVGSDPAGASFEPATALHSDAWDGYPRSFNELFEHITVNAIKNVIFLSGDEHRCCFATARLEGSNDVAIRSIHSSALYAPYVFANAIKEDFVLEETLRIPLSSGAGPAECRWKVSADFTPPGDGFTLIQVRREEQQWIISLRFSLDSVSWTGELSLPR